jgi:arylsulfatase A
LHFSSSASSILTRRALGTGDWQLSLYFNVFHAGMIKTLHFFPFTMKPLVCFGAFTAIFPFCRAEAVTQAPIPSPRPPNIVLILADDMGWNQVGYHGSKFYETPHIDRIAREGIQFRHAYSAAPICSPTRAALMTGKSPARLQLTDYIPGKLWEEKPLITPRMQQGLPLEESTIPELLRTRGYISGLFGKWHLAPTYDYARWRPMDPESQGFDEVYHTNKPDEKNLSAPDAHNAIAITEHAVGFIERHKHRPFLCYVAHNVVHRPLTEQSNLVAKYNSKPGADRPENKAVMGAMIERMDTGIGRILAKLHELQLERDTLVIFTSDNGNVIADQSQVPFRGGKATIWEGGLRVPLAVRWPAKIRAGITSNEPVISHDLFSTLMEVAGVPIEARLHDGTSLLPVLTGRETTLGRDALYWHYPHYHHLGDFRPGSVIRQGRYKLIEWYEGALLGQGPEVELFDLETDQGETRNLAPEMPRVATELRRKLRAWRQAVGAQEMQVKS